MRLEQVEYKIYKFTELSPKVQERVIDKHRGWNVDDIEWFDCLYDEFKGDLKEVGLTCDTFYFSLNRDRFIEPKDLRLTDPTKFVKTQVDEKVKQSIINAAELFIDTNRGYRNTASHISSNGHTSSSRCPRLDGVIMSLAERCDEKLQDILEGFLIRLDKEYEYLTSDEAVKESIEINEVEFLEDGKIY